MDNQEDAHFLIDYVNPKELEFTLRILDSNSSKNSDVIKDELISNWGFTAQSNFSNTTRRLQDLGLAIKDDEKRNSIYLTDLGVKLRQELTISQEMYHDLLHFLHYSGSQEVRKYFLSYKWCSELLWAKKKLIVSQEIVTFILAKIEESFPESYQRKKGGNFNSGGVSSWKNWINTLTPSIFSSQELTEKYIHPRIINNFQVILLSLDYLYKCRGYRYGDPVLLDDILIDDLAKVFFLDSTCCRNLIFLASKLTRKVTLRESLSGTTLSLLSSFTILDC